MFSTMFATILVQRIHKNDFLYLHIQSTFTCATGYWLSWLQINTNYFVLLIVKFRKQISIQININNDISHLFGWKKIQQMVFYISIFHLPSDTEWIVDYFYYKSTQMAVFRWWFDLESRFSLKIWWTMIFGIFLVEQTSEMIICISIFNLHSHVQRVIDYLDYKSIKKWLFFFFGNSIQNINLYLNLHLHRWFQHFLLLQSQKMTFSISVSHLHSHLQHMIGYYDCKSIQMVFSNGSSI